MILGRIRPKGCFCGYDEACTKRVTGCGGCTPEQGRKREKKQKLWTPPESVRSSEQNTGYLEWGDSVAYLYLKRVMKL